MANALLGKLQGTQYGPVNFGGKGKKVTASFEGTDVDIDTEGGMLRVTAKAEFAWPEGTGKAPTDRDRLQGLADKIASKIPGWVAVRLDPKAATVHGVAWSPEADGVRGAAWAVRMAVLGARAAAARLAASPKQSGVALPEAASKAEPAPEPAATATADAKKSKKEEKLLRSRPIRDVQATVPAMDPNMTRVQKIPGMHAPASEAPKPAAAVVAPAPAKTQEFWCYVEGPVDMYHLHESTRIIGSMQPGRWYLHKSEQNGWAHVISAEGDAEGWVPAHALKRQA